MCVPERHTEDDAAKADHLYEFFANRSLLDEQQIADLEPGLGHQLKNCGTSRCWDRKVVLS